MVQNRNKLIELFISNISNAVVHELLEKAVSKELVAGKYRKELITSFEVATRYREKINPVNRSLPETDIEEIKRKIINKVNSELKLRINKGYENINLLLVDELVDKYLKEMKVS